MNGELGCWAIGMITGTINSLRTLDKYSRRGLAKLAVKYMSYNLGRNGIYPLDEIETDNPVSKELMEKLGFKVAFEAVWIQHFEAV